jgi:hypothetical protein
MAAVVIGGSAGAVAAIDQPGYAVTGRPTARRRPA